MNVKHKLLLLAGVGLASALTISGVSFYSQKLTAAERSEQAIVETALRNHVDGDMMHDCHQGRRAGSHACCTKKPTKTVFVKCNAT